MARPSPAQAALLRYLIELGGNGYAVEFARPITVRACRAEGWIEAIPMGQYKAHKHRVTNLGRRALGQTEGRTPPRPSAGQRVFLVALIAHGGALPGVAAERVAHVRTRLACQDRQWVDQVADDEARTYRITEAGREALKHHFPDRYRTAVLQSPGGGRAPHLRTEMSRFMAGTTRALAVIGGSAEQAEAELRAEVFSDPF